MTDYWKNRQKQLNSALEKDETQLRKRLLRYYKSEAERLDKEVASYFSKYGKDGVVEFRVLKEKLSDSERELLFESFEKFALKHPEYANLEEIRNTIYKLDRLQGMQYSILLQQMEIADKETELIDAHLTEITKRNLKETAFLLGVQKDFYSERKDLIKEIVNLKWANGSSFSENIWGNKKKLANYLSTDFAQGMARGDSYKKLSKQLRERFVNVSKKDADRLIFTEGTFVTREAQARMFEQYKFGYVVVLSPRHNIIDICDDIAHESQRLADDGNPFRYEDREVGVNYPPFHPWCACDIKQVEIVDNMPDVSRLSIEDQERLRRQLWIDNYVAERGGDKHAPEEILKKLGL